MRKKISFFAFLFATALVTSCGSNNQSNVPQDNEDNKEPETDNNYQPEENKFLTDKLDKAIVDLSGVKGFVLYNKAANTTNNSSALNRPKFANNETELALGVLKADDKIEEVSFKKDNEDISLDDFDAEPYKIKNIGRFTALSVIDKKIKEYGEFKPHKSECNPDFYYSCCEDRMANDYWAHRGYYPQDLYIYDRNVILPSDFDEIAYQTSQTQKSYLIDNTSGKVYNMKSFGIFDVKDDFIIKRNDYPSSVNRLNQYRSYYSINIDDDDKLVLKDLIPNKNVTVLNARVDKYGWTIVTNDSIDQIDTENKIYYSHGSNKFSKDKVLYQFDDYNETAISHPVKKFENGEFVDVDNNLLIEEDDTYDVSSKAWYKNSVIYKDGNCSSLIIDFAHKTNLHYVEPSNVFISDDLRFIINYDDERGFGYYNLDLEKFLNDGVSVELTKDDFASLNFNNARALPSYYLNVNGKETRFNFVYEKQGLTDSVYYTLNFDGEVPVFETVKERTFDENIYTIEPLEA